MIGKVNLAESWEYSYDHRGMMVTAKKTQSGTVTVRVTYSYDSFGNMLARTDGTANHWSVYDGWDTSKPGGAVGTENFDRWATLRDIDGMLVERRYYGSGWDEFLVKEWGTGGGPLLHQMRWSLTDHQGSLRRVGKRNNFYLLAENGGTTLLATVGHFFRQTDIAANILLRLN